MQYVTYCTEVGSSEVTYTNFSYHGVHIWNIMERNIPPFISYNSFNYSPKLLLSCYNMKYYNNVIILIRCFHCIG